MTQPFKRRKPRPDPAIVIEETEYYDEPNYPNRELPFPKPTGSRRKRSLTDFPRNYEVAQEVTDWSSALDFIDKYADRAKEWWNQLMDRLKHDDYNKPAGLIDRALGAIPLPASRQPRRTNKMRGRRILSQDVSEVVGDPQFDEVREQVSEGLADELGQVVMRTLDDVAAPIEEALGRPLEESEVLDVHEVVTDIVHETLDQVSEEMTEGIAEPVEEEEGPAEEEIEEEEPVEGSLRRARTTVIDHLDELSGVVLDKYKEVAPAIFALHEYLEKIKKDAQGGKASEAGDIIEAMSVLVADAAGLFSDGSQAIADMRHLTFDLEEAGEKFRRK